MWNTEQINEAIVYIARKLHWTRTEIGELHPLQFKTLLIELRYQDTVEKFEQGQWFASLLSVIHNAPISKPKILYPANFIKLEKPIRGGQPESVKNNRTQTPQEMLVAVAILNAAHGGDNIIKDD